jgi:competence protein ComEC
MRASYGVRSFLMMGDAERAEETSLANRELSADVLKVGHHGSRTSTTGAFLSRVRPTFATISCGLRNRFGHPHAETLNTLRSAGVVALRLDRWGGVEFRTDGRSLEAYSFSLPY